MVYRKTPKVAPETREEIVTFFHFQNILALTSKDKEVSRSPILPLQNKGERYLNRPTTSARFRNSQRLIDLQINSETKTARYFRPLSRHLSIYESFKFFHP